MWGRPGTRIGFVLGAEDDINRVHKRLGARHIHMTKLSDAKRNKISRLQFDGKTVAVCAYVEKQLTINRITHDPRFARHRPSIVARRHLNCLPWNCMRETIERFAAVHRRKVGDIAVQCDSDMQDAALEWHMKKSRKGKAHDLADVVGRCNSHHGRVRTRRI